jgi:hypothetical protein
VIVEIGSLGSERMKDGEDKTPNSEASEDNGKRFQGERARAQERYSKKHPQMHGYSS